MGKLEHPRDAQLLGFNRRFKFRSVGSKQRWSSSFSVVIKLVGDREEPGKTVNAFSEGIRTLKYLEALGSTVH